MRDLFAVYPVHKQRSCVALTMHQVDDLVAEVGVLALRELDIVQEEVTDVVVEVT